MNWAELRAQLACTDRGDEMCVDGSTPHQRARLERHALTICADCQHLDRCRAWVLRQPDDPSPVMVVGGMTPGQRRRERFGNQTCGTDAGWQRHRKNGERPCPACLAAHNAYTREHKRAWRAKKNERQQGDAA